MSGCIDKPRGATRWRLRWRFKGGKQETIDWFDSEASAEEGRLAHAQLLSESNSDYAGQSLADFGHWLLTRREVNPEVKVRDPKSGWSRFHNHLKDDKIGRMAPRAIQTHHIHEWIERLENKSLSPASRRSCLSLLNVIFDEAAKKKLLRVNPAAGVRIKGKDRIAWTYLTRAELPKLLRAFESFEERCLAAVAMGTGLRPGELVTLRRADVYLDKGRERIVVQFGSPPDIPTKTGAVRTVYLFGLALHAMRAWLSAPRPTSKNPEGLVFPRPRGGFRDENHVIRWDRWKATLARAGITRRFRWYDLRHSCASWLVSGWWGPRWSLHEVKEHLGHTSIDVTQRYAHMAPSASEERARLTGLPESALSQRTLAKCLPGNGHATEKTRATSKRSPPGDLNSRPVLYEFTGFDGKPAEIRPADSSLTQDPPKWVHEAADYLYKLASASRRLPAGVTVGDVDRDLAPRAS